jgi:hypothetical protein
MGTQRTLAESNYFKKRKAMSPRPKFNQNKKLLLAFEQNFKVTLNEVADKNWIKIPIIRERANTNNANWNRTFFLAPYSKFTYESPVLNSKRERLSNELTDTTAPTSPPLINLGSKHKKVQSNLPKCQRDRRNNIK